MSLTDDPSPSWMDEENDETHSLLFGGSSSKAGDEEEKSQISASRNVDYGTANDEEDDGAGIHTEFSHNSKKSDASEDEIRDRTRKPKRNVILAAFNFLEGFGIVASSCLLFTQLIPLFVASSSHNITDIVLKFYISIFCILFILIEYDAPIPFLKNSKILQVYFSRGFIYSFLGVSALQESYSERVKDMANHEHDTFYFSWLGLFMQVSSWMMFALGAIYMLFSLCCLKRLRDKLTDDHRRKERHFEEAKRMQQWMEE